MANRARAVAVESAEHISSMPNELANGLNAVQSLVIGQARHNLQRQDEWSARRAAQTDRLLANFAMLCDLSALGLSEGQIERLAEMSVDELASLLRAVL